MVKRNLKNMLMVTIVAVMSASMLAACQNKAVLEKTDEKTVSEETGSEENQDETVLEETDENTTADSVDSKDEEDRADLKAEVSYKGDSGNIVEQVLTSGNKVFVYIPTGEDINLGRNATWKPIIMVLGNNQDAESAYKFVKENGFAKIAEQEQCVVMNINPSNINSGWGETDKECFTSALGLYSDSTDVQFDPETGMGNNEGILYFPGYSERTYFFADGAAADFAAQYVAPGVLATVNYAESYYKPASMYLSNVSAAPKKIESQNESVEMPVYLVNAADNVQSAFAGFNKENHTVNEVSNKKEAFDSEAVVSGWNEFVKNVRRCLDRSIDIPDYENGYQCINETFTGASDKEIEYYLYIPDEVADASEGTVPLVAGFHGKANCAVTMAYLTEWPSYAKQNGFIYLAVNKHEDLTDDEVMDLLKSLVSKYSIIDTSRIYCTGFSQGSMRTWSLCLSEKYADFFAACAPMNVALLDYYEDAEELSDTTIVMPMTYIGASGSHLREISNQEWFMADMEDMEDALAYVMKRNHTAESYENDGTGAWGMEGTSKKNFDSKYFPEISCEVTSFASEDGNVYTQFGVTNTTHVYQDLHTEIAWNFLKQFSRDEEGNILIEQ